MSDKVYIGPNKVGSFEKKGEYEPVSRVTMWWGDGEDEYFTAGDDTGREMRLNNPYATQAIVDNAAKMLKGHIYRPFEARDVIWDPTIELGDGINIGGIYSMLGHVDMKFGPEIIANISCPGGNVIDHEIPYIDPDKLEMRRRVKLGQTYFGTKITRKDGLVIENVDDKTNKVLATAVLNANILAFYKGQSREKEDAQLYFDTDEGVFKFRGALNVSNNFVVDADGNVVMKGGITLDGPIKWGTNNTPNKKRYAASTSGPWHDTMQSGDIYCCDWEYTAEKWGEAYKFKGQDGTNGRPGSDADVTRANIVLAMIEAAENDGLYSVDGDDGKKYLGIRASAIKTGVLKAIDIEGCNYYSQNRVGQLKLSSLGGGVADLIFKNPGSDFDTFSVRDEIGSGTLSLYGIPIIRAGSIGGAWAELAENVTVHATFA